MPRSHGNLSDFVFVHYLGRSSHFSEGQFGHKVPEKAQHSFPKRGQGVGGSKAVWSFSEIQIPNLGTQSSLRLMVFTGGGSTICRCSTQSCASVQLQSGQCVGDKCMWGHIVGATHWLSLSPRGGSARSSDYQGPLPSPVASVEASLPSCVPLWTLWPSCGHPVDTGHQLFCDSIPLCIERG